MVVIGKSGFTLVEVLVSVAVVGVLAMIATPVYQKNIAQSQVRESFGLMESSEDQPYSTTALAGYKIQGLNVSIVNKGGKALGR